MLKIDDIIELRAVDSSNRLSFAARYLVQVNFTFDLTVKSGLFFGTAHFCLRKDDIKSLCNELTKMTKSFSGACRLQDNDSDGFIEFTIGATRKVGIYGQLGGTHEDNFMQYKFTSDLSATETLISGLIKLLTYVDDAEYEKEYNRKYKQKLAEEKE